MSRLSCFPFIFATAILALHLESFAAARPNIVLITLDSIRADRVGFLDAKHATPSLDTLAKQSIVFDRAYAQAPLTVVSHATILTGTYPQTHHASELGAPLASAVPYLPEALHARGYRTVAFLGSILLDPTNGFAPGFDRGFDVYERGGRNEAVARATDWLRRNQQAPFFLWVNVSGSPASSVGSYAAAVSSADAALGKLLGGLRAQKLYDEAIIIVASDHGESLGAHGEDTHGIFLYDETIRVPLLLKLPQNQLAGKRVATQVRLLDIAPTALEAAGLPVPSQMQGQSLLRIAKTNSKADLPVYSRSDFPRQAFGWSVLESWRTRKYLYIRAPRPELYDLSTDPNATHNLAQSSKAILQTLASQLDAFDAHFVPHGNTSGTELTSSEMQKLASLGYVGLQKSTPTSMAAEGADPKDTIAIANLTLNAMSALEDDKLDRANAGFQQVLGMQPNTYLAQYGLGRTLAQKQRHAEAIEHLHKAIELQPDSGWANFEIGRVLTKTGDFKTAAIHLEIAAGRLPESSVVHSMMAEVYEKLGRKDDASRERARAAQSGQKP
jgi:arylsulfatase A-like enzyme/Tfp pilus assembly protein PilF